MTIRLELDLVAAREALTVRLRSLNVAEGAIEGLKFMCITSTCRIAAMLGGRVSIDQVLEAHIEALPAILEGNFAGVRAAFLARLGTPLDFQFATELFGAAARGSA